MAQRVIRKGAGRLWEQNINDNFTELFDRTSVSVMEFGAVGDWDGSTGTDDTDAINAALDWWGGASDRELVFPGGWYFYDGSVVVDGENSDGTWRKHNTISMIGRIYHADPGEVTGNPVAWEIKNFENLRLRLRVDGGGKLGDFSSATVNDGGTTFLQLHSVHWVPECYVEGMNYEGRLVHTTSKSVGAQYRVRNISMRLETGNRPTTAPTDGTRAANGQPLYAENSTQTVSIGSWGKLERWRGEHSRYGIVFEDMTDITIGEIEVGLVTLSPALDLVGCTKANIGSFYSADTDHAAMMPALRLKDSATRGTYRVTIDSMHSDSGYGAIDYSGGDATFAGLKIGAFEANTHSGSVVLLSGVLSPVEINGISVKNSPTAVETSGACGRVSLAFAHTSGMTGDVVKIGSTVDFLDISGAIGDTASGFDVIDLGSSNNKVALHDLFVDADSADSIVNIGFGGSNRVRITDCVFEGSSSVFGAGRAEFIDGVRGCQTKSCGSATISSGSTSITVTHGLDLTPQFVSVMSQHNETDAWNVTSVGATQFTINVPSAVTANRTVWWSAEAVILRGDVDA